MLPRGRQFDAPDLLLTHGRLALGSVPVSHAYPTSFIPRDNKNV